jgi:hypothetical protein
MAGQKSELAPEVSRGHFFAMKGGDIDERF